MATAAASVGWCDSAWGFLLGVWKWLVHFFTGHCEIYRLCRNSTPLHLKTRELVRSLKNSRSQSLRGVAEDLGVKVTVEEAVSAIVGVKCMKEDEVMEIDSQLRVCLVRYGGVRSLWHNVEDLRSERYDQDDHTHEELLMKLWENLVPSQTLSSRISNQWQHIGFQGNNPATDFRGMGLLGLKFLLYFSREHPPQAHSVLQHSKHPKFWYPLAVTGIDLCGVMYNWLKTGYLDSYLISHCSTWPPPDSVFMDMTCCVLCKFDTFWMSKEPENIMAFPKLKDEFLQELRSELDSGNLTLTLKPSHNH